MDQIMDTIYSLLAQTWKTLVLASVILFVLPKLLAGSKSQSGGYDAGHGGGGDDGGSGNDGGGGDCGGGDGGGGGGDCGGGGGGD